jgi:hypothetical protein
LLRLLLDGRELRLPFGELLFERLRLVLGGSNFRLALLDGEVDLGLSRLRLLAPARDPCLLLTQRALADGEALPRSLELLRSLEALLLVRRQLLEPLLDELLPLAHAR